MSRSRPEEHLQNPASPFYEWNGDKGLVKYYDKPTDKNIEVGDDFTFVLLDETKTIKGWHKATESGIWSNEVKDLTRQPLVVRTKAGVLVSGFYSVIKDCVAALGGKFVANLYIAYKSSSGLRLAAIQFSGAALHDWADFRNAGRATLYSKAIRIRGAKDGKKGSVKFRTPVFHLIELSEESNKASVALDVNLQAYLDKYLAKNTAEQAAASEVEQAAAPEVEQAAAPEVERPAEPEREPDPEPEDPRQPPAGKPDLGLSEAERPF